MSSISNVRRAATPPPQVRLTPGSAARATAKPSGPKQRGRRQLQPVVGQHSHLQRLDLLRCCDDEANLTKAVAPLCAQTRTLLLGEMSGPLEAMIH